jgi:hypothetical protein
MKRVRQFFQLLLLPASLLFCSCTSQIAISGTGSARFAQGPTDRPGLGTKWGETRQSRVEMTHFQRANPGQPLAIAAIYYNDEAGIRAMAGAVARQRDWPSIAGAMGELISVGLKDPIGFFYPATIVGNRWFVVGKEGRRYSIVLENRTDLRLEVVLSVDGLDALDGGKASLRKRGYVLGAHSRLKIDGFRQVPTRSRRFALVRSANLMLRKNTAIRRTLG